MHALEITIENDTMVEDVWDSTSNSIWCAHTLKNLLSVFFCLQFSFFFGKIFLGVTRFFKNYTIPRKTQKTTHTSNTTYATIFIFFFLQNAHLQENSLFVAFFLNFLLKKIIVLDYSSVSGGLETVCSANFMGTWMYYVYLISKQNAFQV
jgi:hypothetical protein